MPLPLTLLDRRGLNVHPQGTTPAQQMKPASAWGSFEGSSLGSKHWGVERWKETLVLRATGCCCLSGPLEGRPEGQGWHQ